MNKTSSPGSSSPQLGILPWFICGLAAAFYCYEYILRITPGLMVPELQQAFSVHGNHLDATHIALLSVFYYYAYDPMQLPVGLLMDRFGPRKILTVAVLCCALGTAIFGSTTSWWVAAGARFVIGFGSAFAFVGVLKLASTWLPANRFGMVSGMATSLGMVGAMLGGIYMTDLIQQIGWQQTIIYSSVIGFVLVPVIWFVVRDAPKLDPHGNLLSSDAHCMKYSQLWKEIRLSMTNPQIWLNGIIGGLIMVPTMIFPELWGKPYLQTVHQFSPLEASQACTTIFLGWAVGGPLAGMMSDRMGRRKMPVMVGALIAAVLFSIFLLTPNLTDLQISILMFLIGVASSVEVICFAIGRENCPTSLAGTVVAVTNFLVVSFAFFQIFVAKVLDYTWDGTMLEQTKVYSADNFRMAMLVLPVCLFLAFFLSFFLKETYCRPMESR